AETPLTRNLLSQIPASPRSRGEAKTSSIPIHPVQPLQPVLHRFLQVITRPAKLGVAAGDGLVLLAPARPGLGRATRFADDARVQGVDLAVEIGELAIGADRLLDGTANAGAVEAGLAGDRHLRPDALELAGDRLVIGLGLLVVRIELQRRTEIV